MSSKTTFEITKLGHVMPAGAFGAIRGQGGGQNENDENVKYLFTTS